MPTFILDFAEAKGKTDAIVHWWAERWLHRRIRRDEILQDVAGNALHYPVRHGARINLEEVDDENQVFPEFTTAVASLD